MSKVRVCGAGMCDRAIGNREAEFCCGPCVSAWAASRGVTRHHSVSCDMRYDLSGCEAGSLAPVSAEWVLAEQAAAGAHLAYALFYADPEFMKAAPDSVVRAYGRACRAYGVRRT